MQHDTKKIKLGKEKTIWKLRVCFLGNSTDRGYIYACVRRENPCPIFPHDHPNKWYFGPRWFWLKTVSPAEAMCKAIEAIKIYDAEMGTAANVSEVKRETEKYLLEMAEEMLNES